VAISGTKVIATAKRRQRKSYRRSVATLVLDYRSPQWIAEVRNSTGGEGEDAPVNAVPGRASMILELIRDNDRLTTITFRTRPASVRCIQISHIYMAPDRGRLQRVVAVLASGTLSIETSAVYSLGEAADALEYVRRGSEGRTIVLTSTVGNAHLSKSRPLLEFGQVIGSGVSRLVGVPLSD
jgi:NADPH:quinone reductase-like Zn-dependent oxidoreductase